MSTRYAIGVGARAGVDAQILAALVRETAERLGVDLRSASLATLDARENESGVHKAAKLLEMDVFFFSPEILRQRASDVLTHSTRIEVMFGVGSIAEAAALAGAGDGSVLLAQRAIAETLTCAIARNLRKDERS